MRNRWLRLVRAPRSQARAHELPPEITVAFLDLDNRQGVIQQAVAAECALRPASPILSEWEITQQSCYAAMAAYLTFTGDDPGAAQPVQQVQRQIAEAASAVDAFHRRHRATLDDAARAVANAAAEADSASAAAYRLRDRLNEPDARWMAYPSVQAADDRVQTVSHQLESARQRADPVATLQAASQLAASTSELAAALDAAPHQAERARRAVSSVRTRLEAAGTRATGMATMLSALLREFHVNSSADLIDNAPAGRISLNQVDALLQQASTALSEDRPEAALELTAQARTILGTAEGLIDAPQERLIQLRGLRSDPGAPERAARFRLRDAQRLAVSQGATAEWGTALDAQGPRIGRIVAALDAPHPDYWRYRRDLDAVEAFIADVVVHIREQAAR